MKKAALVAAALAALLVGAAAAQEVIVLKIKVQLANVRQEPDLGATVVKQLKLGVLVESRQKLGDWYEISLPDEKGGTMTGYLHANVVDVVSGAPAKPAEAPPVQAPARQPVQQPVQQPAQEPYQPAGGAAFGAPVRGGFKLFAAYGMANISYTIPEGAEEFDKYRESLPGPAFGLGYASGGKIGFEVDVLYLTKGARFKGTAEGVTFDVKGLINEISVPVLLNVNILSSPLIYGLGGGELGYVLSAKSKYDIDATDAGGTKEAGEEDVKDDTSQIDYGLIFGGGVGFPLGPVTVFGELRYHLGLANMEKNPPEGTDTQASPKTRMFLIVAGVRF